MQRRTLIKILIALLSMMLAGVGYVFVKALAPTKRSSEEVAVVSIAELAPGNYRVVEWGQQRVVVVRPEAGAVRVFAIPTMTYQNEVVWALPDPTWDHPAFPCKELSITTQGPAPGLACNEPGLSEWWRSELRWDLDGHSLGTKLPPLPVPAFHMEAANVVLGSVGR